MPLSQDPEARARQLANLRSTSAVQHGANSEQLIRPLREKYLAELAAAFPNASAAELAIQAHRLAQIELLGAFLDERGVIRHKRRGDVFPAVSMAEKLAAAYERQHAAMREREQASGGDPQAAIDAIMREIADASEAR
jgi:hypothetical protein